MNPPLPPTPYSLLPSPRASRGGFTVVEIMLFAAIFAVISITFIAILTSVTRVQVRQTGAAEVSQQSQYLLQAIQRHVERSSLVELDAGVATTSLKLRMASSTEDPTYIYLTGTTLYLKQTDNGTPEPLTSDRVSVSGVSFTKYSQAPARDSVAIAFTVALNSSNPQQQYSQPFQTTIARVNAATFDSNMVPSSSNTYKIGASSQLWQSINDVLYFSGSNVGIGASGPTQVLEVNGGVRLNTGTTKPSCDANARGTFWVTQNGSGVKDNVEVCVRNASSTYLWATIY
ncbi:MAG: hypothetical protein HY978_02185 [Candidatus Liptonbacteria bacterium]|nr:hypothetical protein [Candidatus Liptonbacteria bacterium]